VTPITAQDPLARSLDVVTDNTQRLQQLFPEAFTEGKVDMDVLRELLGESVDEKEEKYGLNWHGKRRARQTALTPSSGTLRPVPNDSMDWNSTENLMIEGDNLEVLKILQKSYAGQVKLIYIDPPYNTGKDFIYPDNFQDTIKNYQELTGQLEGGKKISSNTESSGRFHTDWLNMIYPRLKLARNLLQEDGVIFISIDDSELNNLHKVCDEIFGEENFIANFIWEKRTNRENRKMVSSRHDYVVCYCKSIDGVDNIIQQLPMDEEAIARYKNPDNDPRGLWKSDPATAQAGHGTKSQFYILTAPNGQKHELQSGRCWLFTEAVMNEAIRDGRIWFGKDGNGVPRIKTYLEAKERGLTLESVWFADSVSTNENAKNQLKDLFGGEAVFDTPKPLALVQLMLKISASSGIILDFFAGSGTTGHAVMAQNAVDGGNRRYILVQLPEQLDPDNKDQRTAAEFCERLNKPLTIAELTKERLLRASKKVKAEHPLFNGDLGYRVYKLDSTNILPWDPNPQDISGSLFAAQEHLKEDRTEQDILTELLLKLGLPLTVPIEERALDSHTLYAVGAGTLMACLSPRIEKEEVEVLAQGMVAWQQELAPVGDSQVVLRDSAFRTDVAKANFTAILEQAGFDKRNIRSL
jgi:adenine-specific DNA-methyltransferase